MLALAKLEQLDALALRELRQWLQIVQCPTFSLFVLDSVQAREAIELQHRAGGPEDVVSPVSASQIEVHRGCVIDRRRHL